MRSSTTTTVPATVTGHPPSTSFVALQLLSTSLLRILPLTQIPIPALKTHTISPLLPVQRLPAAGQQQEQDIIIPTSCFHTPPFLSNSNAHPSHPICPAHQTLNLRPPFLAPHLQEQMTSQFQISNQAFSDHEGDLAPATPTATIPSTTIRSGHSFSTDGRDWFRIWVKYWCERSSKLLVCRSPAESSRSAGIGWDGRCASTR